MAERFKAHAWKVCVLLKVPWVRIPLSPPKNENNHLKLTLILSLKNNLCNYFHLFLLKNVISGLFPIIKL